MLSTMKTLERAETVGVAAEKFEGKDVLKQVVIGALAVAPDHPLSRAVAEAAGNPEQIGVAYWMDMALTNAAGIPTVAYGPTGRGEHADVEWVDVASVEQCVEIYLKAATNLCG